MSGYHHANKTERVKIMYHDKIVERVGLIGLIARIERNFELNSHVSKVLKDGYSTLQTLKNNFVSI